MEVERQELKLKPNYGCPQINTEPEVMMKSQFDPEHIF
jgi:hypothetical protein